MTEPRPGYVSGVCTGVCIGSTVVAGLLSVIQVTGPGALISVALFIALSCMIILVINLRLRRKVP